MIERVINLMSKMAKLRIEEAMLRRLDDIIIARLIFEGMHPC